MSDFGGKTEQCGLESNPFAVILIFLALIKVKLFQKAVIKERERSVSLRWPEMMYLVNGRVAAPLCQLWSKDVTTLTGKCSLCH